MVVNDMAKAGFITVDENGKVTLNERAFQGYPAENFSSQL